METNFLTGEPIEFNNVCSITDDRKYIDKATFDRVCAYYRKGHLHSDEIRQFIKESNAFINAVFSALNKCASLSRDRKISVQRVVLDLIDKEKEISIAKYKKVIEVVNLEEYFYILDRAIELVPGLKEATPHISAEIRTTTRGTDKDIIQMYLRHRGLAILIPNHHTMVI